jgi:hypothetical protein
MRNGNIALGLGLFVVAILAASGTLKQLWDAVMSAEQSASSSPSPTPAGGSGVAPSSGTTATPIVGATGKTGAQNVTIPAAASATLAAIPAGLAATVTQHGSDLYNWCLAFVSNVRQAAGTWNPLYGAPTAAAACSQLTLSKGLAPAGATVCFAPTDTNPAGHIGIANGGDSYTSAGIVHGGLTTGSYVTNPTYQGWAL